MTDFIAAIAGGIVQVGIGHPFDTCKTLLQNNKSIYNLKLLDYYRGAKYPLISSAALNSITFTVYERTINYTNSGFLSGFIGGAISSPFIFSFDTGKIKNQTKAKLHYRDYIFGKGKTTTFLRESIAMGISFGTYDYLKKKKYNSLLSGAIAGLCNWSCTYPIDVIKSRQIAQQISITEALKQGNLWKGYTICAVRAVLVNGCIYYTYDTVKKYLD